jgi:hypothetical protein
MIKPLIARPLLYMGGFGPALSGVNPYRPGLRTRHKNNWSNRAGYKGSRSKTDRRGYGYFEKRDRKSGIIGALKLVFNDRVFIHHNRNATL